QHGINNVECYSNGIREALLADGNTHLEFLYSKVCDFDRYRLCLSSGICNHTIHVRKRRVFQIHEDGVLSSFNDRTVTQCRATVIKQMIFGSPECVGVSINSRVKSRVAPNLNKARGADFEALHYRTQTTFKNEGFCFIRNKALRSKLKCFPSL